MKNRLLSSAIFGTALFAALSVFAFYFRDGEVVFLIQSPYRWIIGVLLGAVFLLWAGSRAIPGRDRKPGC